MTSSTVLVLDLDGTLSRTDTLWESLLRLFAARPWRVFAALLALRRGRAGFKRWLAGLQKIEPESLVYDESVLRLARAARAEGRGVWLVSGADQSIVDAVLGHFDFFAGGKGSDGEINLTSTRKAAFLVGRFGAGQFEYAGDSRADFAVWAQASRGYVVARAQNLLARAQKVQPDMVVLGARDGGWVRLKLLAKALRVHQWAKNALLFVPALAGHRLDQRTMMACAMGFVSFSLVASSVYILNDLLDLPHDRAHASKKSRPLASGRLALTSAPFLTIALLIAGFALSVALPPRFLLMLCAYYVTTLAYSLQLKRLMVWDVMTLAGLYTLRIFAGAAAIGGAVSPWLMAFSLFLFFCLAVIKRLTELMTHVRAGREDKISGRGYVPEDLAMLRVMAASCGYLSVMVLVLYMNSAEVVALYRHPKVLWALCPLMMFWISRVLMLAQRGEMHDDPVVFALRDRGSLAVGAAFLAVIGLGMWWH